MISFNHFTHASLSFAMPYLLTRPDDSEGEKLPLLVFLHGAGERGDSQSALCVHGIPKYFSQNPVYNGIRAITLSPQCPDGHTWVEYSEAVMSLILAVADKENADRDRISVTGLSMGGFGTWEMLCQYPDFFSAAAPICGGGMSWRIYTKTPVRAFHGDADTVVPCTYSVIMADGLNEHGGSCELMIYHGCGHDCWTRTYEETNLLSWMATVKKG